MAVKKGYKQTEVGVIPYDWEVVALGRMIRSVEYGSSSKSFASGAIPVIRMGNLQNGKIDWDDLVYTDNEQEIKRYLLRQGDVLFNRTNTIDLVGKSAIYEGERPAIFAGYLIRINALTGVLDTRYLNYILNTESSRKHSAKVLSIAVGQANINGQKLKTYPIPLPPTLPEQKAIAGALSDADAWIESLEQLIAKKRQIKQGAMQELLTGKRRLPGFSGKWEAKKLGDLGRCQRGVSYNPSIDLFSGDTNSSVRLLRSNNVQDAKIVFSDIQFVASSRVSSEQYLQKNDILICMANGSRDLVGKAGRYCEEKESTYTFGAFMGAFRPAGEIANPVFCFYLFQTATYRQHIAILLAGSSINNLTPDNLESHLVVVPDTLAEQTAIATVLSDMDTEIESLESKLAKAREVKQGMMQELLTGRIRLV